MAFDFFFTNIPNHLEFLKWSRGLRTNDDILLVAALEALHFHYYVAEETHPGLNEPRSIVLVQPPFWLDTVHGQNQDNANGRVQNQDDETGRVQNQDNATGGHDGVLRPMLQDKHPINVIEGYADLKKLDGHVYNVIEFAYLEGGWRKFKSPWDLGCCRTDTSNLVWTAIASFVSQILFGVILVFWYAINQTPVTSGGREPYAFPLVFIVALVSTRVFGNIVWKQGQGCLDFYKINRGDSRRASLFANRFGTFLLGTNFVINLILAPCLWLFNIYFVLTSKTPVEAILNAVALAFVLEVDDLLAPFWDDDRTEDAKAKLFHESISEPFPGIADSNLRDMCVTRTGPCLGQIPYQDGDKLYIKVPDDIKVPEDINDLPNVDITVFRSNVDFEGTVKPTENYDTITYKISGPKPCVSSLHEKIKEFYCMENYENFQQHNDAMAQLR